MSWLDILIVVGLVFATFLLSIFPVIPGLLPQEFDDVRSIFN